MARKKIAIPCPHETDGVSTDITVSDYYPLKYNEMRDLILLAFNDVSQSAGVQCRLDQAIEGIVCPREIDGPAAEKSTLLGSVFVDSLDAGDVQGAITKISGILGLEPPMSQERIDAVKKKSRTLKKTVEISKNTPELVL